MKSLYFAVSQSKNLSNTLKKTNFSSPSFRLFMMIALRAGESVRAFKDDTKTAKEQGYNVIGGNWRAFYAPGGISDSAYEYWVSAVKTVANSPEWTELREKNGLAEFTSFGSDFDTFVRKQIENVAALSKELKIIK